MPEKGGSIMKKGIRSVFSMARFMTRYHLKPLLLATAIGSLLLLASPAWAPVIEFVIDKDRYDEEEVPYTIIEQLEDSGFAWQDSADTAMFYSDNSRTGHNFTMKSGEAIIDLSRKSYPVFDVKKWSDKISSFELGPCTSITLWEHDSYNGKALMYRNVERFWAWFDEMPSGWDDRVSSISVGHEPLCFSMSGTWKGGTESPTIDQEALDLSIDLGGKNYKGKILSSKSIHVDFSSTCCDGELPDVNLSGDPETIKWSNETVWTKESSSPTPTVKLTRGLSGKWWLERRTSKYEITITSQNDSNFTAKYSSIGNPSTFAGEVRTDSNGKKNIEFTQTDSKSGFTATHTGTLVSNDRFEGTFGDNRGSAGVKFVLRR
jgi:hypothetical protein